jgi:hypothetical protein
MNMPPTHPCPALGNPAVSLPANAPAAAHLTSLRSVRSPTYSSTINMLSRTSAREPCAKQPRPRKRVMFLHINKLQRMHDPKQTWNTQRQHTAKGRVKYAYSHPTCAKKPTPRKRVPAHDHQFMSAQRTCVCSLITTAPTNRAFSIQCVVQCAAQTNSFETGGCQSPSWRQHNTARWLCSQQLLPSCAS